MNYLFVVKQFCTLHTNVSGGKQNFPTGIAYVAANLKKHNYRTFGLLLDLYEDEYIALSDAILNDDIDVMCLGGLSVEYNNIKAIINMARQIKPSIKVIVGGGLISADPRTPMSLLYADIGVINEGENTIVDIAKALEKNEPLDSVAGIIFLDSNNEYVQTKDRTDIVDLDMLPFPDYDLFSITRLKSPTRDSEFMPVVASRSCPFNCTFCFHPSGVKYRTRKLSSVFDEIETYIHKYNYLAFSIIDELFAFDKSRLVDFCANFKKLHDKYNAVFMAQMRADNVDRESLKLLKESGCIAMGVGMESMDDTILTSMDKKVTKKQIEEAYNIAYEEGFGVFGNLLFGDIAETLETVHNSLTWYLSHRHYCINIGNVQTYPGSRIYDYAIKKGIIKDKNKYLEDGNFIVNLTGVDSEEHRKMWDYINYVRDNITLVSAYASVLDIDDNDKLDVLVRCDYCMKDTTATSIDFDSNQFSLRCQHCMRILHVKPGLLVNCIISESEIIKINDNDTVDIGLNCGNCGNEIAINNLDAVRKTKYIICSQCKKVLKLDLSQSCSLRNLLTKIISLDNNIKIAAWGNPYKIKKLIERHKSLANCIIKIVNTDYSKFNNVSINSFAITPPTTLIETSYDYLFVVGSSLYWAEITDIANFQLNQNKPIFYYNC